MTLSYMSVLLRFIPLVTCLVLPEDKVELNLSTVITPISQLVIETIPQQKSEVKYDQRQR